MNLRRSSKRQAPLLAEKNEPYIAEKSHAAAIYFPQNDSLYIYIHKEPYPFSLTQICSNEFAALIKEASPSLCSVKQP